MKIIRVTDADELNDGLTIGAAAEDVATAEDVVFHPDSTLLLPGRPFFYPDFGGEWVARLYLAVHINRLGKGVSVKFAPRYYDALSIALYIVPSDEGILPPGILAGVDSSITHGEWLEPSVMAGIGALSVNDFEREVYIPELERINAKVAWISRYTTIRTGDMPLLPLDIPSVPIEPRTYLTLATPDRLILNLKIV